jgi:hypothetical protein
MCSLPQSVVNNILGELNTRYSSNLADMVELWANLRDTVVCQRLHTADAVEITSKSLKIRCLYHTWEESERTDPYFQHQATTSRVVEIPLPFTIETEEEAWKALNIMIDESDTIPDL